jgi:ribosomal protein RSM22 (predicted rRNA methylase)
MIGEWICSHFSGGLINSKETINIHKINKNTNKNNTTHNNSKQRYSFHKYRLINNFNYFNELNYETNSVKSIKLNTIVPTTIEEIE